MKNYQYILFDWDGCMAKTLAIWMKAYKEVFAEYNQSPEEKEIALKAFGNWDGPVLFGIKDADSFMKKVVKKVNENYPTLELYEGVKTTLQTLKEHDKKIALLTSSVESMVKASLKRQDLTEYFDVVLTAESVTKHKPDPEIVEKALNGMGGNKDAAIIMGDSKSDLGAAQNAGIDSILFYPQENHIFYHLDQLKEYNPTYIVTEFKESLKFL